MLQKVNLKSEFLKSVVILTTGTVVAQAVGYLIMPLLTNFFYTDEDFGEWGIYMRLVAFVSTVATARYELSIPLPKHEGHSYVLFKVSLRIAKVLLLVTLLASVGYLVFGASNWNDWYFLGITLLSIFFVIYINLGTNWSIRNKAFKAISRQQMVNSIGANSFRLLFGWMHLGGIGLILGTLIGYAISSIWFIRDFVKLGSGPYRNYSRKKQRVLVKEYRDFPLVNLPHVTIDLGRELLVAGFIAYFFGKDIFGQFNHSYLILRLPLVVVGVAIGRVFYQRCLELINDGQSVVKLLKKTILMLVLLAIVPFALIYFYGEPMFSFVFGKAWAKSGYYSEIMALWSLMLFVVSPLSSLPLVLRRQKEFFLIGIVGSLIQLFSFGILPLLWGTSTESWLAILTFVTIAQSCYFFGVCWLTLHFAKKGVKV